MRPCRNKVKSRPQCSGQPIQWRAAGMMQRHHQKGVTSFCQIRVPWITPLMPTCCGCSLAHTSKEFASLWHKTNLSQSISRWPPRCVWHCPKVCRAQNLQGTFQTQDSGKVSLQGIQDNDKGMKQEKKNRKQNETDRNYCKECLLTNYNYFFNDLTFFYNI